MDTKNTLLPFNFSRNNSDRLDYNSLKLACNYRWIYDASLPYNYDCNSVIEDLLNINDKLLINGCNLSLTVLLRSFGFEFIKIRKEAVLENNIDHFRKKSLEELVRRGSKKGKFREIVFDQINKDKLKTFVSECAHGMEPQLKYLFNDTFTDYNRLFIVEKTDDNWLGAILISDKKKLCKDRFDIKEKACTRWHNGISYLFNLQGT